MKNNKKCALTKSFLANYIHEFAISNFNIKYSYFSQSILDWLKHIKITLKTNIKSVSDN